MHIEKHSKKFHVSQRGAATGGVIVTIALLINPKQFGAKLIRFTNKIHWFIAIVSSKWQASLTFSMHQSNVSLWPWVGVWARFPMYSLKIYLRELIMGLNKRILNILLWHHYHKLANNSFSTVFRVSVWRLWKEWFLNWNFDV